MVKTILQFLAMLGINAVPAVGWFVEGWSAGTTLVIYWFENIVACLFVSLRIWLHSRQAPRYGHFKYHPRNETKGTRRHPFGSGFMAISLMFSAAHGVFLAAIILILTHNGKGAEIGVDWRNVGTGCASLLAFQVVDLLASLPGLRKRPFLAIEQMADWNLGRVFIIHLTLIFGMLGVAMTGATKAFFGVFVALKTMGDLSAVVPQWRPKRPPAWLCNIMDRVPNAHPGEKFADFWMKEDADEKTRQEANERPWKGA